MVLKPLDCFVGIIPTWSKRAQDGGMRVREREGDVCAHAHFFHTRAIKP